MADKNNKILNFTWMLKKGYENTLSPILNQYQLSLNEGDVLLFLNNNKNNTANDISKFRSISKSLVSKSINNLEKLGYLNLEADKDDKRINRLYISDRAKDITNDLLVAQKNFYKLLEKDISNEELLLLDQVLKKMYENINDQIESI